jgi:hypothetical protein
MVVGCREWGSQAAGRNVDVLGCKTYFHLVPHHPVDVSQTGNYFSGAEVSPKVIPTS